MNADRKIVDSLGNKYPMTQGEYKALIAKATCPEELPDFRMDGSKPVRGKQQRWNCVLTSRKPETKHRRSRAQNISKNKPGAMDYLRGDNNHMRQEWRRESMRGEKNFAKRPGVGAKISKKNRERMNRPEVKKAYSQRMRGDANPMKRPEVRALSKERTKEVMNTPEMKKKIIEGQSRPEVKARLRELWGSEEYKEKKRARQLENWKNPEYVAKVKAGYKRFFANGGRERWREVQMRPEVQQKRDANRKDARYDGYKRGWIYAFKHPNLKDGVKFGFTTDLEKRARAYRSRGHAKWLAPGEFKDFCWSQEVNNPYDCEQEILGVLNWPPNEISPKALHEVIGAAFQVLKTRVRRK